MQTIITPNLNEARKQILKIRKEKPEEKIAVLSSDDEFNRKALEIKGLNMLVINEQIKVKDYMKQRNSGLNEILAKICANKNIKIGIQINKIINKDEKEKARTLARLMQNIMLCKKAGTKLVFLGDNNSQIDKKAIESLMLVLKASTKQASESVKQSF